MKYKEGNLEALLEEPHTAWLPSFGRIKGRNIKVEKIPFIEDSLENYLVNLGALKNLKEKNPAQGIILEIGFGYGENLIWEAKIQPEKIFIGAEVYINGLAKIISQIRGKNIQNIFLWNQDARILLQEMHNHSLERIFLLFPDPWPKKRHYKRRIISEKFLNLIYKKLKADGDFIIATDHADYAAWIEEKILSTSLFKLHRTSYNNAMNANIDSSNNDGASYKLLPIITRYQEKAAESNIYIYQSYPLAP